MFKPQNAWPSALPPLRSWRCRGIGPAFVKLGAGSKAPVRYAEAGLETFIAQSRVTSSMRAAFEG
jgi:hypothetical protein